MARRVNKRFLVVLTLIVVGVGIAGLMAARLLNRKDPAALMAQARQHVAAAQVMSGGGTTRPAASDDERKEWEAARDSFAAAIRTGRAGADAWIGLGDAMHELTRFDPQQIGEDLKCWGRAREMQPGNPRILRRLLDEYIARAELFGSIDSYKELARVSSDDDRKGVAEELAEVDKDDLRAQAWQYIAPISAWAAGAAVADERIQSKIAALEQVAERMRQSPAAQPAADPQDTYQLRPFDRTLVQSTLAKACLHMAQMRQAAGNQAEAMRWCGHALEIYRSAIEARPDDPGLWYQLSQLVRAIRALEPSLALHGRWSPVVRPRAWCWACAQDLLDPAGKAVALSRNDEKLYPIIQIQIAWEELGLFPRSAPAQTIASVADRLEKLVEAYPNRPELRLQAAEALYRAVPARAAAMLDKPFPTVARLAGVRALEIQNNDVNRRLGLVLALLEYPAAERDQKLKARVDEELQQLQRLSPQGWEKHPRFLLARAKQIQAYSTDQKSLTAYADLMKKAIDGLGVAYVGSDDTYQFIRVLETLRRSGEVPTYLERLVTAFPTHAMGLLDLARLLFDAGNMERASACLDVLDVQMDVVGSSPQNQTLVNVLRPAVVGLRVRIMTAAREPADAIVRFVRKQSLRDSETLAVARVLIQSNIASAAETLVAPIAEQELAAAATRPAVPMTTRPVEAFPANYLLAYIYSADGRLKEAQDVAARVLSRSPGNDDWRQIQLRLAPVGSAASEQARKEAEQRALEAINAIKDPTRRAVRMVDFLLATNRAEEAGKLLEETYAKAPKDPEVLSRLLDRAFLAKDWPAADKYARERGQVDYDESGPLYFQVRLELAKGDKENALAHATELVGKSGQLSRSWVLLGLAQELMGQYDLGIRSFNRALEIQVDSKDAILGLVRCNIRLGNIDQAKQFADRGIRTIDPVGLRSLLSDIAAAYATQGRRADAIRTLEEAVRSDRANAELRLVLLATYENEKPPRWTAIERLLEEAKADPALSQRPDWLAHEISMWRERGDSQKEAAAMDEARKKFPKVAQIETLYLEWLLRNGRLEDVLEATKDLVSADQTSSWSRYAARASALKGLKRDAEAADQFDKALGAADAQPDRAALENLAGVVLKMMGPDWAKQHLGDRKMPHWSLLMAKAFAAGGDWKNAPEMAKATLDKLNKNPDLAKPKTAGAWQYRLWILDDIGRIYTEAVAQNVAGAAERAEAVYREYLDQVQSRQDLNDQSRRDAQLRAMNNLACLFADHPVKPDPVKALTYSQQAYDLMNKSKVYVPGVVDTHAWALVLNGRVDEAVQLFVGLLNRPGVPPEAYYHYAEALVRTKDYDRAERNLSLARTALQEAQVAGRTVDSTLTGKIERLQEKIRRERPASTTTPAR